MHLASIDADMDDESKYETAASNAVHEFHANAKSAGTSIRCNACLSQKFVSSFSRMSVRVRTSVRLATCPLYVCLYVCVCMFVFVCVCLYVLYCSGE